MAPLLVQRGGVWVGCVCPADDDDGGGGGDQISRDDLDAEDATLLLTSANVKCVDIGKDLFDSYYDGCCNGSLWPLFHSMEDRAIFNSFTWQVDFFSSSSINLYC